MKNFGATKVKKIVKSFYLGEAIKIILTVFMVIIFLNLGRFWKFFSIDAAIYIESYILVIFLQNIFWILNKKRPR